MNPKILFICTTCPFGTSGSGVRTQHIARLLETVGPMTMVVATSRDWTEEQLRLTKEAFNLQRIIRYEEAPVRGLRDRRRQIFDPTYLNSDGVIVPEQDRRAVKELMAAHDVTWVHTLKVANAFRWHRWPRTVVDVDDIPSRYHWLAYGQATTFRDKFYRWRSAFAAERRERHCLERFPILTLCKESDRAHFGNDARVHVVPNGFTAPEVLPPWRPVAANPRLGMIGDFGHLPNRDGLVWFLNHVWREVLKQVPDAHLRLAGKSSDKLTAEFKPANTFGLGYVPDTGAEIATWSAMIVPTRLGGGTHLKVAEGLARRTPIVTTHHGARGYTIEHNRHAMIADDAGDFVAACVKLLRDPAAGRRLSDLAAALFQTRYSWEAIGPAVAGAVEHCLKLESATAPAGA